jgi:FAD synthase
MTPIYPTRANERIDSLEAEIFLYLMARYDFSMQHEEQIKTSFGLTTQDLDRIYSTLEQKEGVYAAQVRYKQ